MEDDKRRKYDGKAKSIVEKYNFLKFESYNQKELMSVLKELVNELKGNEKAIDSFQRKIENKDKEIEQLKSKLALFYNQSESLEKYVGYDSNWLYIDKVCFVIERSRKPLNSHQIVDLMLRIEPELKMKLRDPFNSITKSIYSAVKLNRLLKYQKTGNFGFTYILFDWLNDEGKLTIK